VAKLGPGEYGMDFYFAPPNPKSLKKIHITSNRYVTTHKVLEPVTPKVPAQISEPDDRVIENGIRNVSSYVETKGKSRYKKDGILLPMRTLPDLELSYLKISEESSDDRKRAFEEDKDTALLTIAENKDSYSDSNNDNFNDDKNEDTNHEDIGCIGKSMEKTGSTIGPKTWLADSRALCQFTNSDEGMFDVKNISSSIKIGNGNPYMQ
jgi:hypothetical protein